MVRRVVSVGEATRPQKARSHEWYTPSRYIEAARQVLGGIDLDPASCALANETVRATRYFTKDDDGLSKPWHCESLWLNPPYTKILNKSGIKLFVDKLVSEYRAGHVGQGILLATCDSDASWFPQLWDYPICFTDHNVYFNQPSDDGTVIKNARHGHWFGAIFVYLGPNEAKFINTFSAFGTVARRVSPTA